jgi:hypothetical protein
MVPTSRLSWPLAGGSGRFKELLLYFTVQLPQQPQTLFGSSAHLAQKFETWQRRKRDMAFMSDKLLHQVGN